MPITCDICDATSALEETYVKQRKSFRFRKSAYCPACWQKRSESGSKITFGLWGIYLLLGVWAAARGLPVGWLLLNFVLMGVCMILMIVPHELGHAYVARWLGRRVFKIVIGTGRLVWEGRMLGFPCELRLYPLRGLMVSATHSPHWYRAKQFLIVLAGPAVNLGLLLLSWWLLHWQGHALSFSRSLSPWGAMIAANGLLLVANLLPYHQRFLQGKVPSDGLALLTLPFLSKAKLEEALVSYYLFENVALIADRRFEEAEASLRQGLAQFPEHPLLTSDLGLVRLERGAVEDARAAWAGLFENSDGLEPLVRALVANNLAYVDVLLDRRDLLEEADTLSAQVFGDFPWFPIFRGTRGMVCVEMGRLEEGIALLKSALEASEDARSKAASTAYLAIAEYEDGNPERARQYLEAASRFDAAHPLIDRAQLRVASRSTATSTV